jgi:hypothetical protein
MRRLTGLLAAVALSATSCGGLAGKPAARGKTIVVLADVSGSVRDQKAIATYEDAFKKIIATLDPGDVLVAGWITARSESEARLPINEVMPKVRKTVQNKLSEEAERVRARRALADERLKLTHRFDSLLEAPSRGAPNTDILGALDLAQRIFASYPKPIRALVLLSDMIQQSPGLNLKHRDLGRRARSTLMRHLKKQGRIPKLSGVRVWIIGARGGDARRFQEIRSFWTEVFKAAGATLNEADYGGPLVRFNPNAQVADVSGPSSAVSRGR